MSDPYGIGFDEKWGRPPQWRPRVPRYHRNYNPNFKNENGGPPGWFCITCKVGLLEIEYCLQCPQCGLIVIKNLWIGWNNDPKLPLMSGYKYEQHYDTWMKCILAREKITPSLEKVINDVKN